MNRRYLAATFVTTTAVIAVASPAFAHIDPDPTEAQAGSELSVGFTVEHGCDGSPTIQLDMRLPDGTLNAQPEPPDGWTGTIDGNVVTFQGGVLPDDQELTFRVRMRLPPTPDTTIYFPFVQRCEVGEIRWIDIPSDGSGEELDEPAPAMELFGPVATTLPPTTTTAPPTTVVATTEFEPETTPPTSSTSTVPDTTTLATIPAEDNSKGSGGTLVFIGVLGVVGGIATYLILKSRRARS